MTVPLTIDAVVTDATGNVGLASVTVEVVRPAALAAEAHEYCVEHDQPLEWCQQGVEGVTPHGLPVLADKPRQTTLHIQERSRQMWSQIR